MDIPAPQADLDEEPDVFYPEVHVRLTGCSGNTGAIMAEVVDGLKSVGASYADITEFRLEALSGDYNHVIQTCFKWVTVS